jgi:hypothetical protein
MGIISSMRKPLFFIFLLLSVQTGTGTLQTAGYSGNRGNLILYLGLEESVSALSSEDDTAYSFIVAGHAYGAHEGGNIGLHPALLSRLNSGFDSNAAFFVFTGDIVNQSTSQSWQQVENELSVYGLSYYFAMGNHDNNDIGRQVFIEKYGGTFYAFRSQSDLFVVLNSTEADRSIPSDQLAFLKEQINLAGDSTRNVFIFFHEVLWNSHEKYTGVRSNSRSRYAQIVNYSNYWEEVHPVLAGHPGKQFFIFAGDMGGNPDAVAGFYDVWDNVTLLASGMGEVPDENYLLVRVHGNDPVAFELVPLNAELILPGIGYYSVPAAPETITGPDEVSPGSRGVEYTVPEIFNATSYIWELPTGLTGSGISNHILTDVDSGFTGGTISVRAGRDGFGSGSAAIKMVKSTVAPVKVTKTGDGSQQVKFRQTPDQIVIGMCRLDGEAVTIRIFNGLGRLLRYEKVYVEGGNFELMIDKNDLQEGLLFISVLVKDRQLTGKLFLKQDR